MFCLVLSLLPLGERQERQVAKKTMIHPFYLDHENKMVERFLYLRGIDAEYARSALWTYMHHPDCPCPELEMRVRREWMAQQRKAGIKPCLTF